MNSGNDSSEKPKDMKDSYVEKGNEKPEKIVGDIIDCLTELHRDFVKSSMEIGQEIEKYGKLLKCWIQVDESKTHNPFLNLLYKNSSVFLSTARDEIVAQKRQAERISVFVDNIGKTTDLISASTGSTASMFNLDYVFNDPTFGTRDRFQKTSNCLEIIDPSLANTYKSIPEILYGTNADPARSALFMIRQSFDHLFNILASDNDVRKSTFWKRKKGDHPNQVTREERMNYALDKHITDTTAKSMLSASTKHMLTIYNQLNSAHKRGKLDEDKAKAALKEMQVLIEGWVGNIQNNHE